MNILAFDKLGSWVLDVFGSAAKYQPKTGAYRISSRDLGRDLEEDLSIDPRGAKDWGVWDIGDARSGARSAIDIVIEYGRKRDAGEAALWLCERCGVDPVTLGWQGAKASLAAVGHRDGVQSAAIEAVLKLKATSVRAGASPLLFRRAIGFMGVCWFANSFRRRWRPGGVGKSSLIATEALAMVSGKPLLGVTSQRLNVWLWNLEDPHEETVRKIQAAAKRYGLKAEDIGNRLFVDCGRDQRLVIAEQARTGAVIVRPVIDSLIEEIKTYEIDVLIIDPYVSSHRVPENDNTAQDMILKEWGFVADHGNCAVHLVDHTRKVIGGDAEVTTESSRGAKSKTDGARRRPSSEFACQRTKASKRALITIASTSERTTTKPTWHRPQKRPIRAPARERRSRERGIVRPRR